VGAVALFAQTLLADSVDYAATLRVTRFDRLHLRLSAGGRQEQKKRDGESGGPHDLRGEPVAECAMSHTWQLDHHSPCAEVVGADAGAVPAASS
jgi:hypothetical protein